MYLDHKKKLLFVHIPKTGGSIVYQLMKKSREYEQIGNTHDKLTEDVYMAHINYFKFIIVRNSYELMASAYRFQVLKFGYHNSFRRFIHEHHFNKHQLKYFIHEQYGNLMDRVILYENRIDQLKTIFHVHVLPRGEKTHYYGYYDWRAYYTQETIDLIQHYFEDDIKFFAWKFNT